jgi:hypothetical protein
MELDLDLLKISIESLFPKFAWEHSKIHVAQKAGNTRPIDVFTRSFDEWQNKWNGSYHSNHCWNRKYVFSIIEMPNKPDCWLFGGIFEIKSFMTIREQIFYTLDLSQEGKELIGRLVIHWQKDARAKGRKPESMLPNMSIHALLAELYIGEDFPGYSNINHSYETVEKLWLESKPDWVAALSYAQGVYLITDTNTGMRYVGSAYGSDGIWSRWATYFKTGGHANNKLLKLLLKSQANPLEYARKNFRFSLLEHASSRDSEQHIIKRESYWKEVLLTRGKFGLNEN